GGVHVFARLREIPGSLPLPHILEHRAMGFRPRMDGRAPRRLEQLATRMPHERAEGDRGVRRAEGGEANFWNGLVQHFRGDGQTMKVRGLALIGRHARGGEALDVLDGAHALTHGLTDILCRHVVLEVYKSHAGPRTRSRTRHAGGPAFG